MRSHNSNTTTVLQMCTKTAMLLTLSMLFLMAAPQIVIGETTEELQDKIENNERSNESQACTDIAFEYEIDEGDSWVIFYCSSKCKQDPGKNSAF